MFSQGNAPFMYCRPRGLNSLWVSSRTVATMRLCSSVSLKRNESSALMIASPGRRERASGPIRRHNRQACRKAMNCGEAITVAAGFAAGSLRCMKPCSASG